MGIGQKLSNIRKTIGIPQEEISKKSGIQRQYLSRIENDRVNPSYEFVEKIAESMGLSIEFLKRNEKEQWAVYDPPKEEKDSQFERLKTLWTSLEESQREALLEVMKKVLVFTKFFTTTELNNNHKLNGEINELCC